jgi:hypothetical protein
MGRRSALTAVMAVALGIAALVSSRSIPGHDVSEAALPDACENLAFVQAHPEALAHETFMLGFDSDSMARLQDACERSSRL